MLPFPVSFKNEIALELPWLEKQLWVSLVYYHFVLPHHSLRCALPEPVPTRDTGSEKRWQSVTPALAKPCPIGLLAARLTDHVWTTLNRSKLFSHRLMTLTQVNQRFH